ncbi:MAG: MerR family transcriptional regulator [Chitinophagales bacterium]
MNKDEKNKLDKLTKRYYSIGEVAKMFNVSASLIRFWEGEFSLLRPRKNQQGNRLFTAKDIENLHLIYHLVKERGYTLEGAKRKLKQNKTDTINNFKMVQTLKKVKSLLIQIRDEIT